MPFNGSGIFQRVYDWTQDRDAGTKILAERVDEETDGIVAGLNAVVGGTQGFIGPVKAPNGTTAAPAFSFSSDTNTGMYRDGADVLGFAVNGTLEGKFEAGFFDAVNGLKIGGQQVTATAAELNKLDGVTASASEINVLDGITADVDELNILDGVIATASELNKLAGTVGAVTIVSATQTLTNKTINLEDNSVTVDGTNPVGFLALPFHNATAVAGPYDLQTSDVGKLVRLSNSAGLIGLDTSDFSEGDVLRLVNESDTTKQISVTGVSQEFYISGSTTLEGDLVLAARGVCEIIIVTSLRAYASGSVTPL